MLYYVKYLLKSGKLNALAEEVQSGGFPYKAKHVFASRDNPYEGITIWDVDDNHSIEDIVSKLKEYAEVRDIIPVVSAVEAQQQIFQKLV